MKTLVQSVAVAAALAVAAGTAHAQNVNRGAQPTYGQVTMQAGFQPDPFAVTVMAGGPVDASRLGEGCIGLLPQAASYTFNYRANGEWPLYIGAVSDGDAVIAVRAPDGRWYCNDDTNGLDPAVHFPSPRAGRYQIWVGVYGGEPIPAMVVISEVGLGGEAGGGAATGAMPDWTLDPAYGAVDLVSGFEPDPHVVAIAAGGELDASVIPGCWGAIARAPDYRVNFTAGNYGLPLIFSVNSDADTVLVINGADGQWVCDDDGGNIGLNPSITFANPQSGQYDIWVGTFAGGGLQASELHVSEVSSQ
jgi:hypothetical protein